MRHRLVSMFLLCLGLALHQVALCQEAEYDFALPPGFLEQLRKQPTLETKLKVVLTGRTGSVHPQSKDCEMHLAGTLVATNHVDWDPEHIVVEPPNLCVNAAPTGGSWGQVFDTDVLNKTLDVTGFFRIFTEHASGDPTPANPNHTFEIHPATAIGSLDFRAFFPPPEDLTAITAKTASSCLEKRTLSVRYDSQSQRYEFKDSGGQCGNFVIVQIASITRRWIKEVGLSQRNGANPGTGGHSAIARVSTDGQSRHSVKIYTMPNTAADQWLQSVDAENIDPNHTFIHGIFTYDWFALVKALHNRETGTWTKPTTWKAVPFPLALVVFGTTETRPRGWLGDDDD